MIPQRLMQDVHTYNQLLNQAGLVGFGLNRLVLFCHGLDRGRVAEFSATLPAQSLIAERRRHLHIRIAFKFFGNTVDRTGALVQVLMLAAMILHAFKHVLDPIGRRKIVGECPPIGTAVVSSSNRNAILMSLLKIRIENGRQESMFHATHDPDANNQALVQRTSVPPGKSLCGEQLGTKLTQAAN
jgi:hypothetical protein